MNNPPSRKLTAAVALIASAMLIIELVITRLFSVLFYYHYSFFAVSLVMSGISLGAILASRWKVRSMEAAKFNNRLSLLAVVFAGLTAAGLAYLAFSPGIAEFWWALAGAGSKHLTMGHVAGAALVFLPGLIAAGAFLASAFARHSAWIGRLYAADLAAAAAACLAAIGLMRVLPGPMALLPRRHGRTGGSSQQQDQIGQRDPCGGVSRLRAPPPRGLFCASHAERGSAAPHGEME